ncbi:TIGR00282 family metallophosphoesterase [Dendrosporobacter sp. 1207_IL3150]|uniref:TIGR00282 family metallophosphoesterase n=1 Tax=Dendrosporobacter sp. 1207_IL3150 TaxID=3084054 RepID=UPI002FDA7DCF
MKILIIGDICGSPGRKAAAHFIPLLQKEHSVDLTIANGENAAGGVGITASVFDELLSYNIDIVTSGNHIWDKKEIFNFIDGESRLIRPANYPPGTPGLGYCFFDKDGIRIAIINLAGRAFMPPIDCPFREIDNILEKVKSQADIIIVDFHAEATSEKMALGWYLDGRVSCIVGTHTHIQTSDERILPNGTAYITDLGMVGPWNSVLGVEKDLIIKKFLTGLPVKFNLADGPTVFSAVLLTVNVDTGKAESITRIFKHLS